MKIGIYSGAIPPPVFINNLINGLVEKNDTVILLARRDQLTLVENLFRISSI